MVAHIEKDRIHGRDVWLIRIYNDMKQLSDPTKCSLDFYECSEVVCSKEALEVFNEVADQEALHEQVPLETYDKIIERIIQWLILRVKQDIGMTPKQAKPDTPMLIRRVKPRTRP